MNKSCIFAFVLGAVAGSIVTWKTIKTKYERIAQEEIDSVKEVFSRRETRKADESAEEPVDEQMAADLEDCKTMAESLGYVKYHKDVPSKEERGEKHMNKEERPYLIQPDEFGEAYGYERVSLTYYTDGILTDEWDNPIECVDDVIGLESLEHFGDNKEDPDTVYVRNDTFKIDYEIMRDLGTYKEVVGDE